MKELTVKNLNSIEGEKLNRGAGNEFIVKAIIPRADVTKCRASFVEVEPGNQAFSYHYHEMNEEFSTSSAAQVLCVPQKEILQ